MRVPGNPSVSPFGANISLLSTIISAGLTTNLRFVGDVGMSQSYPGTGQKWLDQSGAGYDFFLGADGNPGASDPVFVGSQGALGRATLWSFDGAQYFTYDTTNETWMQNIHKDNALMSYFAIARWPATSGVLFGDDGDLDTNVGFGVELRSDGTLNFQVSNGSGARALNSTSSGTLALNAVHAIGGSYNEAGGAVSFHWGDGNYVQVAGANTFDAAYTSPSAASAAYTMQIGARGNAQVILPATAQVFCFAVWEGVALSKASFDKLFHVIRRRFAL